MLAGTVRYPPRRQVIIQIADYLECTLEQRNTLLLSGGYAPERHFLEADGLEKVLTVAVDTISYLPLPASVLTREWNIYATNAHFETLFGSWFTPAHRREKNVLRLFFDPELEVRQSFQRKHQLWERVVRRLLYRFRLDNVLAQHEAWYLTLLDELMQLPDFDRFWNAGGSGEEGHNGVADHIELLASDGRPIMVYTLEIHLSTYDYPLICAHIPCGERAKQVFAELGLPTPENSWGSELKY